MSQDTEARLGLGSWTLAPWQVAEEGREELRDLPSEEWEIGSGTFELPDGEEICMAVSATVENLPMSTVELNKIMRPFYEQRDAYRREIASAMGVSPRLFRQESELIWVDEPAPPFAREYTLSTRYIPFPDPFPSGPPLTEEQVQAMKDAIDATPQTTLGYTPGTLYWGLCVPMRRPMTDV